MLLSAVRESLERQCADSLLLPVSTLIGMPDSASLDRSVTQPAYNPYPEHDM